MKKIKDFILWIFMLIAFVMAFVSIVEFDVTRNGVWIVNAFVDLIFPIVVFIDRCVKD